MAYGLSIFNQNGTQIISEGYTSYYILASGLSPNGQFPYFANPDINQAAYGARAGDILYVRPHTLGNAIYNDTVGNATYQPQIQPVSTSGYVEWVLTRRLTTQIGASNYGMRIYRADGTTAYDAQIKGIHPVFMVRDTANEGTFGGGQSTIAAAPYAPLYGRKRFVARGNLLAVMGIVGGYARSSYLTFNGDGSIALATRAYAGWSGVADKWSPGAVNYLFCDILV